MENIWNVFFQKGLGAFSPQVDQPFHVLQRKAGVFPVNELTKEHLQVHAQTRNAVCMKDDPKPYLSFFHFFHETFGSEF